jgi:(p)ppGpp synthase/HD superfamily hydrolase
MLSDRFTQALILATDLHAHQTRKGVKIPYIAHLLAVASIVLEYGGSEDEAIAALLHDAIEDCGGDRIRQQIRHQFGDNVTAIVDGCSDTDLTPKPPWKARKEAYIDHLKTAPPSVRLVSMADKLHNSRSLLSDYRQVGEALWARFTGHKEGTLWYYRSIVTTLRQVESHPLVGEIDRVVTELESLVYANLN